MNKRELYMSMAADSFFGASYKEVDPEKIPQWAIKFLKCPEEGKSLLPSEIVSYLDLVRTTQRGMRPGIMYPLPKAPRRHGPGRYSRKTEI